MRRPGLFFLIIAIIVAVAGLIVFQIMNAPRLPAKAKLVGARAHHPGTAILLKAV